MTPFVLLDEFYVDKPAGFPMHHHQGFEFVTYMIEGSFLHKDDARNEAEVPEGGAQRASTGRGITHSEMPGTSRCHVLQLWVNLPDELKDSEPEYQLALPGQLGRRSFIGGNAVVIVGAWVLFQDGYARRLPRYFS